MSKRSVWAIVLGLSFVALAIAVATVPWVSTVDLAASDAVRALRSEGLDRVMLASTFLGDSASLVWIALLVVGALLVCRSWGVVLVCGLGFGGTFLVELATKVLVQRARPVVDLYAGREAFSFPSGHMANGVVILGALALLVGWCWRGTAGKVAWGVWALFVALIGFSRVYLGAHWPSDVLAGGLLGGAVLLVLSQFLDRWKATRVNRMVLGVVLVLATLVWVRHLVFDYEAWSRFYAPRVVAVAGGL